MNNSQTTIKESICVKVLWLLQKKKKKMLVTPLYLTLCDPMDRSPSGSSVYWIL